MALKLPTISWQGDYPRMSRIFWTYVINSIVKQYYEQVPELLDMPVHVTVRQSIIESVSGTRMGQATAYEVELVLVKLPSPIFFVGLTDLISHEFAHLLAMRHYGRKPGGGYYPINRQGNNHPHVVSNDIQNKLGLRFTMKGLGYKLFARFLGSELSYTVFNVAKMIERADELEEIVRTRSISGRDPYW